MKLDGISGEGIRRVAQKLRGFDDADENYTDNDVPALGVAFIDFLIERLNYAREVAGGPERGEDLFKRFNLDIDDWHKDDLVRDVLNEVAGHIKTRITEVDQPIRGPGAESFGAE